MFHDAQLDFVTFVFEKVIDHFEKVLFSFLFSYNFGDLMETFAQSHLYFLQLIDWYLVIFLEELIVDFKQLTFPLGGPQGINDRREVVRTTVNDLFLFSQRCNVRIDHPAKLHHQLIVDLVSFQFMDELS